MVDSILEILLVLEFNGPFSYEMSLFPLRPILDPNYSLMQLLVWRNQNSSSTRTSHNHLLYSHFDIDDLVSLFPKFCNVSYLFLFYIFYKVGHCNM